MDENRIVIDCPVCNRTIWNGAKCLHGAIPDPLPEALNEGSLVPEPAKRKEIPPYKRRQR